MTTIDRQLEGLDVLEVEAAAAAAADRNRAGRSRARKVWSSLWPRLAAIALVIGAWQFIVWLQWRPRYVLPGPSDVFPRVWEDLASGELLRAAGTTMRRAAVGFALSIVIGGVVGVAVSRVPVLRAAVGSLITGLQTMPSVAWFPIAILLFQLSEGAILFVVIIGAAPSVANGVIAGIDHVPPLLVRAGKVLGARGVRSYRYVIGPAALPSIVSGLKQGWAFAWRSLMAGELVAIIANRPSLGVRLHYARELSDAEGLLAAMIVILVIGIVIDALVFGRAETALRRRFGLIGNTA